MVEPRSCGGRRPTEAHNASCRSKAHVATRRPTSSSKAQSPRSQRAPAPSEWSSPRAALLQTASPISPCYKYAQASARPNNQANAQSVPTVSTTAYTQARHSPTRQGFPPAAACNQCWRSIWAGSHSSRSVSRVALSPWIQLLSAATYASPTPAKHAHRPEQRPLDDPDPKPKAL